MSPAAKDSRALKRSLSAVDRAAWEAYLERSVTGARADQAAMQAEVAANKMTIPDPRPDVVASIDAGLQWLHEARITGVSKAKVDGKTVYRSDPTSTDVYWARFYDLRTSRPVFPGRDAVLYGTFEEMAATNDLGYPYFTTLPDSIVRNGPKKWRKMLASRPQD
jgi:pectinesterase